MNARQAAMNLQVIRTLMERTTQYQLLTARAGLAAGSFCGDLPRPVVPLVDLGYSLEFRHRLGAGVCRLPLGRRDRNSVARPTGAVSACGLRRPCAVVMALAVAVRGPGFERLFLRARPAPVVARSLDALLRTRSPRHRRELRPGRSARWALPSC